MKRALAFGGIVLATLALTACGPEEGYVTARSHSAAYYSTQYVPVSYDGGKSYQYLPVQQYHPESWSIWLCEEPPTQYEDRHCQWRSVDEDTYNTVQQDEYWTAP